MTVGELKKALDGMDDHFEVLVYDQLGRGGYTTAHDALLFDLTYLGNGSYTKMRQEGEIEKALIIQ